MGLKINFFSIISKHRREVLDGAEVEDKVEKVIERLEILGKE